MRLTINEIVSVVVGLFVLYWIFKAVAGFVLMGAALIVIALLMKFL